MLGVRCLIAGTGYTGERGCELGCAPDDAVALWDAILDAGIVPCGLGARDTLRLEVCYPLHGNDISPERTPIEAGLGWACALDKEFTGVEVLRRQKEEGTRREARRLRHGRQRDPTAGHGDRGGRDGHVGLALADARPGHRARLRRRRALAAPETTMTVDLRGRPRAAHIVKKPIYKREE